MDFQTTCLDEIALEGLDGITISALWVRLNELGSEFPLTIDADSKKFLWSNVIAPSEEAKFYVLPKPRPPLVLANRFSEEKTAEPTEDIYPLHPIYILKTRCDACEELGSCADYKTREDVTDKIRGSDSKVKLTLSAAIKKWGEKLVIVASQRLRTRALFGDMNLAEDFYSCTNVGTYYLLERIGRSRYNGEVSHDYNKLFNMSPKNVFYMRKRLLKYKLVTVQLYSLPYPDQSAANLGRICHLKRFTVDYRPKCLIGVHNLCSLLQSQPTLMMKLTDIRERLELKDGSFKRLFCAAKKYVKIETVAYRVLDPEAPPSALYFKNKTERVVKVGQLVKPFSFSSYDAGDDEVEDDDDNDDYDDDDGGGYDDAAMNLDYTVTDQGYGGTMKSMAVPTQSYLNDRTILYQSYLAVDSTNGTGLGQAEISERFGLSSLGSRLLIRNLQRRGVCKSVWVDSHKVKFERLVTMRHFKDSGKSRTTGAISTQPAKPEGLSTEEIIKSVVASVVTGSTEENIVKPAAISRSEIDLLLHSPAAVNRKMRATERNLSRIEIILDEIKQNQIIHNIAPMVKRIRSQEDVYIDVKTLRSLLGLLIDNNKITYHEQSFTLENGENVEVKMYCEAGIMEDSPSLTSFIQNLKLKYTSSTREGSQPINKGCKFTPTTKSQTEENDSNKAEDEPPIHDVNEKSLLGYQPRMSRMCILHKYLWFLAYGEGQETADSLTKPINEESVAAGDETLSSEKFQWMKQVPKLQSGTLKEGWVIVGDAVNAMPVTLLCQVVSITYRIEGLKELMNDSATKFTAVTNLPHKTRQQLLYQRRPIRGLYEECKNLARIGLLTLEMGEIREKEQIAVYVHRYAKVIDTTAAGFGLPVKNCEDVTHPEGEKEREERKMTLFELRSMSDVLNYWNLLQFVCFNTPRANIKEPDDDRKVLPRFADCLRGRKIKDLIVDVGDIPGDGLGAGGLDSIFWAHRKRNWSNFVPVDEVLHDKTVLAPSDSYSGNADGTNERLNSSKKKKKKKQSVDPNSIDHVIQNSSNLSISAETADKPAESSCLNEPSAEIPQNNECSSEAMSDKPAVIYSKDYQPVKGGKGAKRPSRSVNKSSGNKKQKKECGDDSLMDGSDLKEESSCDTPDKPKTGRGRSRLEKKDDIDRIALSLKKRQRVLWTEAEDSLLLLCFLTHGFLTSLKNRLIVPNSVIRDIMHENLQISHDKDSEACKRRISYMMKSASTRQHIGVCLANALHNKKLVEEYKVGKSYSYSPLAAADNEKAFRGCLQEIRNHFNVSLDKFLHQLNLQSASIPINQQDLRIGTAGESEGNTLKIKQMKKFSKKTQRKHTQPSRERFVRTGGAGIPGGMSWRETETADRGDSGMMELPDSMEALMEGYNVTVALDCIENDEIETIAGVKRIGSYAEPMCEQDVHYYVLHNVIHCVLLLTDKMGGRSHELYQLLRAYPESILESVLKTLRDNQVITKVKVLACSLTYLSSLISSLDDETDVKSDLIFDWILLINKSEFNVHILVQGLCQMSCKSKRSIGTSVGCYQLSQRYAYNFTSVYPRPVFITSGATFNSLSASFESELPGLAQNSKLKKATKSSTRNGQMIPEPADPTMAQDSFDKIEKEKMAQKSSELMEISHQDSANQDLSESSTHEESRTMEQNISAESTSHAETSADVMNQLQELEEEDVGSNFVNLEPDQANAVLTSSLFSAGKLVLKTKVPDKVIVVDNPANTLEKKGAKKRKKKPKLQDDYMDYFNPNHTDDDDDDEIITKAEPVDEQSSDFTDFAQFPGQSSRMVLSVGRCYYVHSETSRNLAPQDKVLVNACTVLGKLSNDVVRKSMDALKSDASSGKSSNLSESEMLQSVRQWNHTNVMIHPKSCELILRRIRALVPNSVGTINFNENLDTQNVSSAVPEKNVDEEKMETIETKNDNAEKQHKATPPKPKRGRKRGRQSIDNNENLKEEVVEKNQEVNSVNESLNEKDVKKNEQINSTKENKSEVERTVHKVIELHKSVYQAIKENGILGLALNQLLVKFSSCCSEVDQYGLTLTEILANLMDEKLIVRVGVIQFRYVARENVSDWLIKINKNIKGRAESTTRILDEVISGANILDRMQKIIRSRLETKLASSTAEKSDSLLAINSSFCVEEETRTDLKEKSSILVKRLEPVKSVSTTSCPSIESSAKDVPSLPSRSISSTIVSESNAKVTPSAQSTVGSNSKVCAKMPVNSADSNFSAIIDQLVNNIDNNVYDDTSNDETLAVPGPLNTSTVSMNVDAVSNIANNNLPLVGFSQAPNILNSGDSMVSKEINQIDDHSSDDDDDDNDDNSDDDDDGEFDEAEMLKLIRSSDPMKSLMKEIASRPEKQLQQKQKLLLQQQKIQQQKEEQLKILQQKEEELEVQHQKQLRDQQLQQQKQLIDQQLQQQKLLQSSEQNVKLHNFPAAASNQFLINPASATVVNQSTTLSFSMQGSTNRMKVMEVKVPSAPYSVTNTNIVQNANNNQMRVVSLNQDNVPVLVNPPLVNASVVQNVNNSQMRIVNLNQNNIPFVINPPLVNAGRGAVSSLSSLVSANSTIINSPNAQFFRVSRPVCQAPVLSTLSSPQKTFVQLSNVRPFSSNTTPVKNSATGDSVVCKGLSDLSSLTIHLDGDDEYMVKQEKKSATSHPAATLRPQSVQNNVAAPQTTKIVRLLLPTGQQQIQHYPVLTTNSLPSQTRPQNSIQHVRLVNPTSVYPRLQNQSSFIHVMQQKTSQISDIQVPASNSANIPQVAQDFQVHQVVQPSAYLPLSVIEENESDLSLVAERLPQLDGLVDSDDDGSSLEDDDVENLLYDDDDEDLDLDLDCLLDGNTELLDTSDVNFLQNLPGVGDSVISDSRKRVAEEPVNISPRKRCRNDKNCSPEKKGSCDINSEKSEAVVSTGIEEGTMCENSKNNASRSRRTSIRLQSPPKLSTYRLVRLVPRPWRTPEGTVNRAALRMMLESVMSTLIERPGVTRLSMYERYGSMLQPVAVLELLEILEDIGCIRREYVHLSSGTDSRCLLFSNRKLYSHIEVFPEHEDKNKTIEEEHLTSDERIGDVIYSPTSDAILKLGQFLQQLSSGLRTSDINTDPESIINAACISL